jgi:signal transduction histidine kinase
MANSLKTVFVVDDDGLLKDLMTQALENRPGDLRRGIPVHDRRKLGSLAGLSHDLRTPLTAIKIALDGLRNGDVERDAETAAKLVEIGRRNIDRVIRIVENELEMLRVTLDDTDDPR